VPKTSIRRIKTVAAVQLDREDAYMRASGIIDCVYLGLD
jgi:hypothetical protein